MPCFNRIKLFSVCITQKSSYKPPAAYIKPPVAYIKPPVAYIKPPVAYIKPPAVLPNRSLFLRLVPKRDFFILQNWSLKVPF